MQPRYSWPLPALSHWEVKVGKVGGTSINDVRGTGFAGSASPFLGRERAAVDVVMMRETLVCIMFTREKVGFIENTAMSRVQFRVKTK